MSVDEEARQPATPSEGEVVRWYTRARRFPQLIGRTPDGTKLIGGPYTVTQVVGAGAVFVIGLKTTWLWAHGSLITNAFILIAVTVATLFGLGQIPVGTRNPVAVVIGAFRALAAPRTGHLAGQTVRIHRPRAPRPSKVLIATGPLPTQAPAPAAVRPHPAATPEARPAPRRAGSTQSAGPRPLTGVQSLLASAAMHSSTPATKEN